MYIRLKDRIVNHNATTIFIDVKKDKVLEMRVTKNSIRYFNIGKFKDSIKSDTIEELCDEFVLDHPSFANNCKCLYHSFSKAKQGIRKHSDDAHLLSGPFVIYGAIWTDKGLIYVAKMNKKGELELL